MQRKGLIISLTIIVGILMVSMGVFLQQDSILSIVKKANIQGLDIKNLTASLNVSAKDKEEKVKPVFTEVEMEVTPSSIVIPPRIEVYEKMTLEEVAMQLDKSLKNDIAGKGMVIAAKSIELGVDPFVAAAIMMHETGCGQSQCSSIARNCYNFGGQKGSGCGMYKRYNSIDEGLEGIINNLYKNYYSMGLNTIEKIAPKYAESTTWASKVTWYVNKIKSA
ncbi:MAG: glucosaminidase domain-containing protein [Bacilli bacterium]|nr:glucosaminidase domain-containing protein [Bacilli bacterium]